MPRAGVGERGSEKKTGPKAFAEGPVVVAEGAYAFSMVIFLA